MSQQASGGIEGISPRISRRSTDVPRPGHRSILVPVDDAEECEQAVQWALKHVKKPGDRFCLFHIISTSQGAYSGVFTGHNKHQEQLQQDHAQSFINERFVSKLQAAEVEYEVEIIRGRTDTESVGEAVCNRAVDLCAALVVMAAHNRGTMVRFIIGSTTQYCIEHCQKTVMVMHG
ncbi:hypothetical protein WJX73_007333 [Symbiochloris irregularis]|uniref:UspA domain-containing protein n=1 Tax=Symbiochloris irregularis TaxID=706552 RepID=A0AAW1NW96_9CHLO